jgi:hypothetical protein
MTKSHIVHFFSSFSNRDQAYSLIHGYWLQGMKSLYEPYKLSKLNAENRPEVRRSFSLDIPHDMNYLPFSLHSPPSTSPPQDIHIEEVQKQSPSTIESTTTSLSARGSPIDIKRKKSIDIVIPDTAVVKPSISTPTPTSSGSFTEHDKRSPAHTDDLPMISITEPPNPPHSVINYLDKLDELDQDQINDIFQTSVKLQQAMPSIKYPVCTTEFFDVILGNKSDFMKEFHEKVHDIGVEIDPWVDINVSGLPIARGIMYKIDNKKSSFGSLFTSKQVANVLETERIALTKNKQNTQSCIVLHSSLVTQNLARDEMFQVETKFFIIDTRKSTSLRKECKLEVQVGANCKGAFWKNSAEANAIKAAKKRLEVWLEIALKYIQRFHKWKMEARYDQERAALEANVISAMAKIENVPSSATKLLLPIPPLLHPSPPPSPRQRKRLEEMFSHEELMKPEMPLPSIARGTHNFNHRHMHYSTDDKRLKEEYIEGYTHHEGKMPAWHDGEEEDEIFVNGSWREPSLPVKTTSDLNGSVPELNGELRKRKGSSSSPTSPLSPQDYQQKRRSSDSFVKDMSLELVDMLVQSKTDSYRLFDEPAPGIKKEEVNPEQEKINETALAELAPSQVKEEPKESVLMAQILQILQTVVGVLMELFSTGISLLQKHGVSAILVVTLFAVVWAVYYNIRINREYSALSAELAVQMRDSRAQFHLAQDILAMTEKEYDKHAVRQKILAYMIENDRVVPPVHQDETNFDELAAAEGPSLDELLDLMRKEIEETQKQFH